MDDLVRFAVWYAAIMTPVAIVLLAAFWIGKRRIDADAGRLKATGVERDQHSHSEHPAREGRLGS